MVSPLDVANPQGRNEGTAGVKKRFAAIGGGGGLLILAIIIGIWRGTSNSNDDLAGQLHASVRLVFESVPSVLSDSLEEIFVAECTEFFSAQLAPDLVDVAVSLTSQRVNNGDSLVVVLDVNGWLPPNYQTTTTTFALTSAMLVELVDTNGGLLVENLVGTNESLFTDVTSVRAEEQE